MPEDFNRAIAQGGKVITKKLKNGKYIHLVMDKKGKWHAGEVKEKKNGN